MKADQHILFPAAGSAAGSDENGVSEKKLRIRNCDNCDKEYSYKQSQSHFCSDKCRKEFKLKNSEEAAEKKPSLTATPVNNKYPLDVATTIDLLKKEAQRWEKLYEEQRKELKRTQTLLERERNNSKDREFKQRLDGIEDHKPDFMDRIAQLPPQVLEAFTPILGRLGNLLIPDVGVTPMAGVQGQLDESTADFLVWVDQLPDDEKKDFFDMLAALRTQDPPVRKTSLMKVKNLFTNGTTIQAIPYNASMYGN